jgi:hypothetical protein
LVKISLNRLIFLLVFYFCLWGLKRNINFIIILEPLGGGSNCNSECPWTPQGVQAGDSSGKKENKNKFYNEMKFIIIIISLLMAYCWGTGLPYG